MRKYIPFWFLLPFFVFFVVFRGLPLIYTLIYSLIDTQTSIFSLQNFLDVLTDSLFYKSIVNTVIIFLVYIIIKIPLVLVYAIEIYKSKHLRKVILPILYIPTLVGMFAYAIMFRYLFTSSGLVNQVLNVFGLQVDWFGTPFMAQLMLVIALVWSSLGIYILLVHNSIKNIPHELHEVFLINGGTYLQKMKYLFIPYLMPVIKTIVFFGFLECISLIDVPLNLTQGGPFQSTVTIGYYIYLNGIHFGKFEIASAVGIILILFTSILFMLTKSWRKHYEIY